MTPDIDDDKQREKIALFRYGLIADLIHLPPGERGLYAKLTEKASREHDIPGTLRRRVAAETLRGWLGDWRKGGFDALLPKTRSDAGKARAIPSEVADVLVHMKDENRALTVPLVIEKALASCRRASSSRPRRCIGSCRVTV